MPPLDKINLKHFGILAWCTTCLLVGPDAAKPCSCAHPSSVAKFWWLANSRPEIDTLNIEEGRASKDRAKVFAQTYYCLIILAG